MHTTKFVSETLSASFVLLGSALVDQIDELDADNELDDKIKYLRMKVYWKYLNQWDLKLKTVQMSVKQKSDKSLIYGKISEENQHLF